MRISARFVRQMLAGHSALGLALGALIYLVCVTGTLDVFVAELRAWEQPHAAVTVSQAFLDTAAVDVLRHTPTGGYFYLLMPQMEAGRARAEVGVGGRETQYLLDAQGHLGAELRTPWTDFVDRTHMYLSLPQTIGLVVVGLIGAALLSLLLSGVLAHPRIFRDAFTLRWGGSRRLQEADLHNRLSVWGLPFHLAVVLTGTFFGLSNLLVLAMATAAHHGDTGPLYALLSGPHVPADAHPAPLPPIGPMLTRLGIAQHPERVNYVGVENAGTKGTVISFEVGRPGRLSRGEREFFDVAGHYLGAAGYIDGAGGRQTYSAAAALHFGSFGGLPVRLAYGVLGVALCVIVASGVSIWSARRRDQGRPAPIAETLWLATVWGVPAALALSASLDLIGGVPPVVAFCCALLVILGAAVTRGSPREASRFARLVLAASLAILVILHVATVGRSLDAVALSVDAAWGIAAAALFRGLAAKPAARPGAPS